MMIEMQVLNILFSCLESLIFIFENNYITFKAHIHHTCKCIVIFNSLISYMMRC